jgi:antitoxin HigA-1
MKKIKNIHPGEVLREEFLKPLGITAYRLSKEVGLPESRISKILLMERSITAATACRFAKYFGNSATFWLGLQADFDIEEEIIESNKELNLIHPFAA